MCNMTEVSTPEDIEYDIVLDSKQDCSHIWNTGMSAEKMLHEFPSLHVKRIMHDRDVKVRVACEDGREAGEVHVLRGFAAELQNMTFEIMEGLFEGMESKMLRNWHSTASGSTRPDDKVLLKYEKYCSDLGYSTFTGGAEVQRASHLNGGAPYTLVASAKPTSKMKKVIKATKPLIKLMWEAVVEHYPLVAEEMLRAVPEKYRVEGTGFTKVTMALKNPTQVHHDQGNFGITVIFELCCGGIEWGDHVIVDDKNAFLFRPRTHTLFIGPYTHLRHANLAVSKGGRWICTAYCGNDVVNWAKKGV